jgi:hypothetical protein
MPHDGGRLFASREELRDLFEIDLVAYEPFILPAARDHRRWTVDDTEALEALYVSGASVALIALLLGHSEKTVLRWVSASQLRRAPRPTGNPCRRDP